MNTYPVIRRVHLAAGLLLLVWVLLYFVTGWVMIHEEWFPRAPHKTVRMEPLADSSPLGTTEFITRLETVHHLNGQRQDPKRLGNGSWRFNWVRPGENIEALVSPGTREVKITVSDFNASGLAHGLHRLHGYRGGPLYHIWAAVMDLASASMIVFAISGIYLWWRTTANRWPGILCLGFSFGFTAVIVVHLL